MNAKRPLNASEQDRLKLVRACEALSDVHMWRGNSPQPEGEGRQAKVRRRRYSVEALCHKPSITLDRKSKRGAGLSYLRHKNLGRPHRVSVRGAGSYNVSRFRGVLWVRGACIFVGEDSYQVLRVCGYERVTLTYTNSDMYTERKTLELCDWSARGPLTPCRLLAVHVSRDPGCLRIYRSLTEAYADLAKPAHKLIYATPFPGVDHPVALINRAGYPVCPGCDTVFHKTTHLSEHLGLKNRWSRMSWKTFLG